MRYPVAVWEEDKGAFSASVPDLPGAITMGSSLKELESMVKEAAEGWMECVLDLKEVIPLPSTVEHHLADPFYADAFWMLIDLPRERFTTPNSVTANSFTCCKASAKALQHVHAQRRLSSL